MKKNNTDAEIENNNNITVMDKYGERFEIKKNKITKNRVPSYGKKL